MANTFFVTSIILIFLSAVVVGLLIFNELKWTPQWCVIGAICSVSALVCGILGIVCIVISSQRASEHNTIPSAFHYFIIKYYILYIGKKMLQSYHACCKDPRKVQQDCLLQIIKHNKDTDYGRQFKLGNINSLEDLRTRHPVTDYSHYEKFVNKIAKGGKNVLTTEKITRLVLTSGTTGKGKRIPQNDHYNFRRTALIEALQYETFPDLQPMQPKLILYCNSPAQRSECGITVASLSALESHAVKNMVVYSTPPNGFLIENFDDAMYIHLLFALRERNLGSINGPFTGLFLETMKFLQANWHKLVEDLARGTINPDLKLLPHIRSSLTIALGKGDPRRAAEVQKEFEKGFDKILLRLWPHLKFISAIDNVGIRNRLKTSFAKGLKICSAVYASSEVLVGLNLCSYANEEDDYVLNLADTVFEFIPESEMDKPNPQTLLVHEVEPGKNYELLITQSQGLYRYSFGDVINVCGFYQNCPRVKFLYRKATLLSLIGEKTSQPVIEESLDNALYRWREAVELSHYSVAESYLLSEYLRSKHKGQDSEKPFYVFFLELKPVDSRDLPGDLNAKTLAKDIDKNILEHHDEYFRPAIENQLSRSKVFFVKPGSFNKLRDFVLANSTATRVQFKMPLKLRTVEMLAVLISNALE